MWQLQGLWKTHAMLLITLLTLMILLSCASTLPISTGTTHSTISATYDTKDVSVANGTIISQKCQKVSKKASYVVFISSTR